jgi:hypothetical protein
LKCSSIIHQFVDFEDAHQHDIDRAKAGLLPLLIARPRKGRLFSFSFDLALRAASGPSDIVTTLERVSRLLQRGEDRWLLFLGGGSRTSTRGQGGARE